MRRRGSRKDAENTAGVVSRRLGGPLTAKRAKRLVGVGKAVAPLLAPYALAAATRVRARWDEYRAARLGVPPDQLGRFSGPGGMLHVRISHVAQALAVLEAGAGTSGDGKAFAGRTRPRLEDLAVAVRAAEQMPTQRRRTAFRAVSAELDRIESDLLAHLGVEAE